MNDFNRLFDEPFFRSFLGFDRFRPLFADMQKRATFPSFPPVNIYQTQSEKAGFGGDYVIQLALAGYAPTDIQVSLANNLLTIESSGSSDELHNSEELQKYLYKGIAKRAFKLTWPVADGIEVVSAHMDNGLLEVVISFQLPKSEIKKIPVLTK